MSDSDSDEAGDLLAGLARPNINVHVVDDDDDDADEEEEAQAHPQPDSLEADDGDEEETGGGLVGAEAAFDLATAPGALELDPFRVAAAKDTPEPVAASSTKAAGGKAAAESHKLFVGGLPHGLSEAGLVKFFARFGKVQEATIVSNAAGMSRGFGFVKFVSMKGSRYCVQQAGGDGKLQIDGRECTVRFAQERDDRGAGLHGMPARGSAAHLGIQKKGGSSGGGGGSGSRAGGEGSRWDGEDGPHGVATIAAAQKRERFTPGPPAPGAPAVPPSEDGAVSKRAKKKEIVTVSRRQVPSPPHAPCFHRPTVLQVVAHAPLAALLRTRRTRSRCTTRASQ